MIRRVPILVYHHVYEDDDPGLVTATGVKATGTIGVTEFRRHLSYIAEKGWTVVSTTAVVDWLGGRGKLPDRAVVLHFDNGWQDTWNIAMPILDEYGFTGTCYIISEGTEASSAGRAAAIQTSTEGAVSKPCVTWKQAEELVASGWEIGAHTATHARLADLLANQGKEAVVEEIERSNQAYTNALGFVPSHFAYPSGSRDHRTDAILGSYYRSLRRWHFSRQQIWSFTDRYTSPMAMECQNVDNTVAFLDFGRIFEEAIENDSPPNQSLVDGGIE